MALEAATAAAAACSLAALAAAAIAAAAVVVGREGRGQQYSGGLAPLLGLCWLGPTKHRRGGELVPTVVVSACLCFHIISWLSTLASTGGAIPNTGRQVRL
jgi:hypothetical protein